MHCLLNPHSADSVARIRESPTHVVGSLEERATTHMIGPSQAAESFLRCTFQLLICSCPKLSSQQGASPFNPLYQQLGGEVNILFSWISRTRRWKLHILLLHMFSQSFLSSKLSPKEGKGIFNGSFSYVQCESNFTFP